MDMKLTKILSLRETSEYFYPDSGKRGDYPAAQSKDLINGDNLISPRIAIKAHAWPACPGCFRVSDALPEKTSLGLLPIWGYAPHARAFPA
jgi:hypothetical protein